MGKIEIEAPTAEQKAENKAQADTDELIALAGSGRDPVWVISRLMAKGVPREEAERILPEILQATRPKRQQKKLIRCIFGVAFCVGGFGTFIYMLTQGVLFVWPCFIGGAGITLLSGYLDNVSDLF